MSQPSEREIRGRRAAAAIVSGEGIDSGDFLELRSTLINMVRRTAAGMSHDDTLDVVDASIEKLFRAAIARSVKPETALAYLRQIVRYETIDRLRRVQRRPPIESLDVDELIDDDTIARFIDERATAAIVEQLLAKAAERRDFTATKVIGAYLRLAASYGTSPSYRSVAEAAEVTHPTVKNVLDRLREEIADWDFPN